MATTTSDRKNFRAGLRGGAALSWAALLPFLVGALTPTSAGPEDEPRFVAKSKEAQRLAEVADSLARIEFQGAVLLANNGEPLVALGLGHADLEGKVANDANTLFEIASASKQFTAAAILRLVAKKQLALDDSIADHLPDVPADCHAITVRHLLHHTSGIPSTNSEGGGTDLAAVVPVFLAGGPQNEPGTNWDYWNQGYALLAGIVEHTSGDPFTEFSIDELFERAKMEHTTFNGGELEGAAKKKIVVAIGRSAHGEPRSALEHPYGEFGYQYRGMGGVVTNVWDLYRWDRALDAAKILDKKLQAELFRPGLNEYALGWFLDEQNGRTVQHHSGSVRGFIADVRRYPETDGCLFVLCNDDALPLHQAVAFLETALFGGDVVLPPLPLTADTAAPLIGAYGDERGTKLIIDRRGNSTHATFEYPAGQRTAAYLGLDDDRQLVLWDWRERHAARLSDDGALELFGTSFRRAN
jgi:CubicO group peptidase (beta-lactamase class C family)